MYLMQNKNVNLRGSPRAKKLLIWAVPLVFFRSGLVAGRFLFPKVPIQKPQSSNTEVTDEANNSLVNPLVECQPADKIFPQLQSFKDQLEALVQQVTAQSNHVDFVSVYFRDLNNCQWIGINEDATFSPASLLKTPLMIAYLKTAQKDPSILQRNYTFV